MRGKVRKKTPKKKIDKPSFLKCHKDDFWDTLSTTEKSSKRHFGCGSPGNVSFGEGDNWCIPSKNSLKHALDQKLSF